MILKIFQYNKNDDFFVCYDQETDTTHCVDLIADGGMSDLFKSHDRLWFIGKSVWVDELIPFIEIGVRIHIITEKP